MIDDKKTIPSLFVWSGQAETALATTHNGRSIKLATPALLIGEKKHHKSDIYVNKVREEIYISSK